MQIIILSKKNYVSPKSLLKNDPFQIGLRYTTPLMVTPFKDDQTKYGNSPICVMGSVREGLKTTSPTVSPYKQTIIHGEEGQCTTSSLSIKSTNIHANEQKNDMLNVGEGINTTSPTVIQKVPRQKELEKFQSTTSFRTPESVKNNYSYVNKDKRATLHLGEGFTTTSSTVQDNDDQRLEKKEGHCATSSTTSQMKESSNTASLIHSPDQSINNENITADSFSHSSLINILHNEKPRDA